MIKFKADGLLLRKACANGFRPNIDSQTCFVLMPFSELPNDYFNAILAPAAESIGLHAVKADQIYGTGAIIQDIWESIWSAQVVIADVTSKNPNVNYELGLCHALGVPTILISQEINDVPFDNRHRRCILYDTRAVEWQKKLENNVRETMKAVLSGKAGKEELEWPTIPAQLGIWVQEDRSYTRKQFGSHCFGG